MGYGDNRHGGDDNRYRSGEPRRDGNAGGRWERERSSYGSWGSERDRESGRSRGRDDHDDRGFMERAGERVRSWFGDDDDHDMRGRGFEGRREPRDDSRMSGPGRESFGAGFGNQRGWRDERWDRDFGPAEGYEHGPRAGGERSRGGAEGWRDQSIGGGSGGYDATMRAGRGGRGRAEGDSMGGYEGGFSGSYGAPHDPHYAEWRQRQIEELDRDYADYRRENQSRFEQEFGGLRQKRQSQRQLLANVTEHMEVVGSDGQHVGTVDKVLNDRIILTRTDSAASGAHHSIPSAWIESVEGKVTIAKTAEEATTHWRDEDRNRALFERHDQGRGGPHVLNRSFSGTSDEDEDKKR